MKKKTNTKRTTAGTGSVERLVRHVALQCSVRRLSKDRVLLSCGEAFLETNNKGIKNMITALRRVLAERAQLVATCDVSQTSRRRDTSSEISAGESPPAPSPSPAWCRRETQSKSRSRHPRIAVCLFYVVSFVRNGMSNNLIVRKNFHAIG
jgi:hypothetical protein